LSRLRVTTSDEHPCLYLLAPREAKKLATTVHYHETCRLPCCYVARVAVSESDVAILIPAYRQAHLAAWALESALATDAGEIIVSDDRSADGTQEVLSHYRDPRLRIVEQASTVGLWRNHLALLQMTRRPWIKFLQQDDRLLPGGLAALVRQADHGVGVVSSLPRSEDLETKRTWGGPHLTAPVRWTSDAYMERLLIVGNELGRPSATLFRSDVLERSPIAWENDMSADLVANVLAASRGSVVLIPSGAWCTGEHPGQDIRTQGFRLMMKRICRSQAYLANSDDARVRRFASVFFFAESLWSVRAAFGALRRGRPLYATYPLDLAHLLQRTAPQKAADASISLRCLRWTYAKREGRPLEMDPAPTLRIATTKGNM
jgi:glycosyltransferase involved in cell wall biosynthesis